MAPEFLLLAGYLFCQHNPARRKRHIACDEFFHFIAKLIARSFCCSSLPNQTRLRWALVWVRRKAAAFSYRKEISILTVPSKNPECVRDFYLFPLHDSFFLIFSLSTEFLEGRGRDRGALAPPARRSVGWSSCTYWKLQNADFNRPVYKESQMNQKGPSGSLIISLSSTTSLRASYRSRQF